ncbi:MAG: hypothetical protein JWP56_2322, partial [Aeromicrobium sp.]|nr:hypothetical protein [Aeromicrobium sp.]
MCVSIALSTSRSLSARVMGVTVMALVASFGVTSAAAASDAMVEWSTTWTQQESVTVTETATVNGFVGTGSATSTQSATATASAKAATNWEVYYVATMDAY